MKYLVIGDSNSMHIFNFVKTFLLPSGYDVYLLTLSTQPIREDYREYYRQNKITVFSIADKNYKSLNKRDSASRVVNLWRKLRLMKYVPHVDICHVHSVYKTAIAMVLSNRKKFDRLILSYWGGDIEDRKPETIKLRERCFPIADVITVTVQQTMHDFWAVHGHAYDKKLRVTRFSTKGIDCIAQLSRTTTRNDCRDYYHIPCNKICITCGYSAYAEQHQDDCLREMMKLPAELREKIYVIVPMQYGRFDEEYIQRVHRAKSECDYECTILEEYVPFEVSAKLAVATDIYLHLRDSDAFSNSLKEHVYAGSTVVTGKWLKYIELEQMNAPIVSIESIEELHNILSELIGNARIADTFKLFAPMYELYSTSSVRDQWEDTVAQALMGDK